MRKTIEPDTSSLILKHFLLKVYSFRYFYVVCLTLFIATAVLYIKYSHKVFRITSTIGPVQDSRTSMLATNNIFRGSGGYNQDPSPGNDLSNLSSFTLVKSVVNNLNLEVGYFSQKNSFFKQTREIYLNSPFLVIIDKSHIQPIDVKFFIYILNDSTFRLSAFKKKTSYFNYIDNKVVREEQILNVDTICKFSKTISNQNFKFSVSRNKEFYPSKITNDDIFYFNLYHLDVLSLQYLEKLNIEPVSLLSSTINVQFTGENLEKSLKFLDRYINFFLEESLAKKNKISINTINFIDTQISEISDSLNRSESKLKNYRTANKVMDLSFQGQATYQRMTQIETDRTNLEVQIRYYNYVINLFKTNQDVSGVVPPMSANITDPVMNQLITELLALNTERSNISNNNSGKNLFLGPIENKIKMKKQAIIENVTNNLNTLNLTLNELNYRSEKLSQEISNLPKTEMNMVNMQRKYTLNDAIFTFLLQKRSEAQITLASNYPDYEIKEPAREISAEAIRPKVKLSILMALFLGFLIPTLYFVTRDFFNDKIGSIFDIEHLLNRSVLGVIYSNREKYENIVVESPRSAVSESFRSLRSSLVFKLKSDQSKVILITSAQPQDGKSFVSFNLAASIASAGFKTVILDCDLRRPVLHDKFKMDNSSGLSNFMVKNATMNEIVHKTSVDNLSFIPSGPILANPSELIDSGVLEGLLQFLKTEYEYVIIDTAPIGLVADAIQLMKYASIILVVSRNNFTRKNLLAGALNSLDSNKIENYDIILNDIDLKKSPYSEYSNYYVKE
jgi:tyrosine-protein kinase Etk/Wzc